MLKRLRDWFLPVHLIAAPPAIRLILGKDGRTSFRRFLWHVLGAIVYLMGALIFGHWQLFSGAAPVSRTYGMMFVLTFAVYLGQLFVSIGAYRMGLFVIQRSRSLRTWDMIRVTAGGGRQAVRAAWVSILFYRLSGWLGVLVYSPRVLMFAILWVELMAFRGEYLGYIIRSPNLGFPMLLGTLLIAFTVVAAFILPLTAVGLEVAVGLLFSTFTRSRFLMGMIHLFLSLARAVWGLMGTIFIASYFLRGVFDPSGIDEYTWLVVMGGSTVGDWGFSFLYSAGLDNAWRGIPLMPYMGLILMAVTLAQLLITEGILWWAARRAQRME